MNKQERTAGQNLINNSKVFKAVSDHTDELIKQHKRLAGTPGASAIARQLGALGVASAEKAMSSTYPVMALVFDAMLYGALYEKRFGSQIGSDGVLGEGVKQILQGIRTLLNGELGELDGGSTDSLILALAEAMEFDPEEI